MSTVYRARRADEKFRKQVALKVLKKGMDTEDLLRRFDIERHILARLEHPHIARLLDAGSSADGRPYFVMELVEGLPLDRYCDRHRLSIGQRLDLFQQICGAVAYAHRNLVVHRDLKPGNILVSESGVPKLLDFGIAKLLDPAQAPRAAEVTAASLRMLTPSYASPEQITGAPVTTASDVYSLGVLLFELLCGRRPYRVKSLSMADLERSIREQQPLRPSTAVVREDGLSELAERQPTQPLGPVSGRLPETATGPARLADLRRLDVKGLQRRLRGDLDAIVLRTLRKEPGERYSSVERLSDDLDRHRRRLPVRARRGTFRYRAGRFLRRNGLAVSLAATAALLLLAFVTALGVQTRRLSNEREASQQRWRRAEAVKEFLVELFPVAESEDEDARLTVRDLLERGSQRLDGESPEEPAVQAALQETVARVYQRLGRYEQAAPFFERGLELYREGMGEVSPEVANGLKRLAILRVQQGDYAAAEPLFRETLDLHRRLYEAPHEMISSSLNNLALLLNDRGLFAQSEVLYREALAMDETLLGRRHPYTVTVIANLGLLLLDRGDYDESEKLLREAAAARKALLGERAEDVMDPLTHLGALLTAVGRFDEAEAALAEALSISHEHLGEEHPETIRVLHPQAELLRARGETERALELYREVLDIRQRRLGGQHPEVATALVGLGQTLLDADRPEEAGPLLRRALSLHRESFGAEHPSTALALAALSRHLLLTNSCAEARPLLREALAVQRRHLLGKHPQIIASEALEERCRAASPAEAAS